MNRNKKFRAFYTNDDNAFDDHGIPKVQYEIDMNAQGQIFPESGWYLCQIRKFKGNFSTAFKKTIKRFDIADIC